MAGKGVDGVGVGGARGRDAEHFFLENLQLIQDTREVNASQAAGGRGCSAIDNAELLGEGLREHLETTVPLDVVELAGVGGSCHTQGWQQRWRSASWRDVRL